MLLRIIGCLFVEGFSYFCYIHQNMENDILKKLVVSLLAFTISIINLYLLREYSLNYQFLGCILSNTIVLLVDFLFQKKIFFKSFKEKLLIADTLLGAFSIIYLFCLANDINTVSELFANIVFLSS